MFGWYRFPSQIDIVPRNEGVYLLANSKEDIVYVGRADNLQDRLRQHPDPKNLLLLLAGISLFAFEETNESEILEQKLIDYHRPRCNRM